MYIWMCTHTCFLHVYIHISTSVVYTWNPVWHSRRILHPCLSPCVAPVHSTVWGTLLKWVPLVSFWGAVGFCTSFYFPAFFHALWKDWTEAKTEEQNEHWIDEIVGGMLKSMRRVGGQFWKSELDVKLREDCLIKSDFVEQKDKFVSRLNSVTFIYR